MYSPIGPPLSDPSKVIPERASSRSQTRAEAEQAFVAAVTQAFRKKPR